MFRPYVTNGTSQPSGCNSLSKPECEVYGCLRHSSFKPTSLNPADKMMHDPVAAAAAGVAVKLANAFRMRSASLTALCLGTPLQPPRPVASPRIASIAWHHWGL